MKKNLLLLLVMVLSIAGYSQQATYDVTAGQGNGLRFWSSDSYKIHMGNTSAYHYGPVTDYSIKMNMHNNAGRGWTWGLLNQTPIAALSNVGQMQLAREINALNVISRGVLETQKTSYTKIQLAQHDWSGSHALLFNAYRSINVSGSLATTGNTRYANNQGAYGSGAGAIMFFANGGLMDFFISPAAGASGKDTDIAWGTPKMRISRSGNVGIGTTNIEAGYKLSVNGSVRATEVKVEAYPWPDYVFASDYELKTLADTKGYIDEHSHLPGMPSAKEVEENGIALGEMNAKLLEKIEELTLYVLQLHDRNNQMKIEYDSEIQQIKRELESLKQK